MTEKECPKRTFTLMEAQQVLHEVRALTERAVSEVERLSADIQQMAETDPARTVTAKKLDALVVAWTGEVQVMGVEVKGLWLVDFDSGDGYYCWRYPEASILHYHGYDEGFTGRMKIV